MYDIIIKNTEIIDGSGAAAFSGSVGVRDGKIIVLPAHTEEEADREIDGRGRYTCPGFIDAHSHGDAPLGERFASLAKISQGITTQVAGMCGMSMFPVEAGSLPMLKETLSTLVAEFPQEMETFTSCKSYMAYARRIPKVENTKFLVGHLNLRAAAMGYDNRGPNAAELEKMKAMLREAMENGAGGMSSGLIYVPSAYADAGELTELCKIVAEYGGIYTTHMRNEAQDSCQSVAEAIEVARRSGVRLVISHHKIAGKGNWGDSEKTLAMIREANENGISVSCDQYPYTASMTHLSVCAPPKYYSAGMEGMLEQLKDPVKREAVRREMNDPNTPYDNFYLNSGGWSGVFIAKSLGLPEAENRTVREYAEQEGIDPFDAFCRIMIRNNGVATAIYFAMCREDVFRIIQYEKTVVGTDGILRAEGDKAHPRAYGTFPHAIRVFVRENHLFTLEEMIRKMTWLTAQTVGIEGKGLIRDGWDADLLVFDYDRLYDAADYKNPTALTEGMDIVIVNGEIVYQDKKLTGATPGRIV